VLAASVEVGELETGRITADAVHSNNFAEDISSTALLLSISALSGHQFLAVAEVITLRPISIAYNYSRNVRTRVPT